MGPMGLYVTRMTRPYFQKVDNPSIWYGPVVRNFSAEKFSYHRAIPSYFGGHGDKKLHFFTKIWSGNRVYYVPWGSNGYTLLHITYLNYVDIFTGGAEKIDFQGVQNCKNDQKIGKMTIFWSIFTVLHTLKIEFYY